jgi:hypothetical protein
MSIHLAGALTTCSGGGARGGASGFGVGLDLDLVALATSRSAIKPRRVGRR